MDNISLKVIDNISLQLNPILRLQLSPRGNLVSPLIPDNVFLGMPETPNSQAFTQAQNYQTEEGFLRMPSLSDAVQERLASEMENWSTGSEARKKNTGNKDCFQDPGEHGTVEPTKESRVENAYSTALKSSPDKQAGSIRLSTLTWSRSPPEYPSIGWSGAPPDFPSTPNFGKFLKDIISPGKKGNPNKDRCYSRGNQNLGPERYNSLRETVISSQRNPDHKIPERYKSLRGNHREGKEVDQPGHFDKQKLNLHKTELCMNWSLTGKCGYGNKCHFAHGIKDLRPRKRLANFKTQPCCDPARKGCRKCLYGSRCSYAHPGEAIRRSSEESYFDHRYYKDLENDFGENKYPFGIYI